MQIHVIVSDQTVTVDGESCLCPDLAPPEDWAWAYHWIGAFGVIEPQSWLGRDAEYFEDPSRIQFAVDAFNHARLLARREAEAAAKPTR